MHAETFKESGMAYAADERRNKFLIGAQQRVYKIKLLVGIFSTKFFTPELSPR